MENFILIVSDAETDQARINYISSDLIQHAYLCTERSEIEALKEQSRNCGLFEVERDIQTIWDNYKSSFINEAQSNQEWHLSTMFKTYFGL
jgi:hypothetical protein